MPFTNAPTIEPAELTTCGRPSPSITFEGYPQWHNASVKLTVGGTQALISREEIAALAALFPCAPKQR